MKRIIATILALTLLSALAVIGVSATDFVPSTDAWEVRLVSAEANGEDVTSKIIVTHYKDRDTLSAEKKAALQAAYEELLKGVSNVTGDYKVGALFDISYEGEIPEGTTVKVKLELNYGDYVAATSGTTPTAFTKTVTLFSPSGTSALLQFSSAAPSFPM